jgi:cytochrome c biogenesis protein CcdA
MMERVEKLTKQGIPGAFAIGALFALSFCPVSAALFFGSMLPLSAQTGDYLLLPLLYGIGTALPVLCFSLVIIFATNKLGNIFNIITQAEKYLRYLAIILFIGIGIYYIIRHNFGIVIF